jgi:hypothetical protein
MKIWTSLWLSACLLAGWPVVAYSQTVAEHALVTAGSSAAATASRSAGKAVGAVFDKLGKTLDKSGKSGAQAVAGKTQPVKAGAGPAAPVKTEPLREFADPTGITVGLERRDLIEKFGEPTMKTSDTQGAELVETYWYTPARRDGVVVTLRDGKVTVVAPAAKEKQQSASVIVLQ